MDLRKYPRTPHLEGSGLQRGDADLDRIPFAALRGQHLVVEEKVDGANVGISFDDDGAMRLQCRGHFLTGGPREAQFALLKPWAQTHRDDLFARLGTRRILYGEWLYARHTVYYDALPHYLLEFDIYDRDEDAYLSTPRRAELLEGGPVRSVPVLHEGALPHLAALTAFVRPSRFRTPVWRENLRADAHAVGADPDTVLERETDPSDLAEGLYVKHEAQGRVIARAKWVRPGFVQTIVDSGSHWMDRPLIPNRLAEGVDLWIP